MTRGIRGGRVRGTMVSRVLRVVNHEDLSEIVGILAPTMSRIDMEHAVAAGWSAATAVRVLRSIARALSEERAVHPKERTEPDDIAFSIVAAMPPDAYRDDLLAALAIVAAGVIDAADQAQADRADAVENFCKVLRDMVGGSLN